MNGRMNERSDGEERGPLKNWGLDSNRGVIVCAERVERERERELRERGKQGGEKAAGMAETKWNPSTVLL